MPGALFDIGYVLMDETPRLRASLRWLAERLPDLDEARLHTAYVSACTHPDPEFVSLISQSLVGLGLDRETAQSLRKALPWDAVPLVPYADVADALDVLADAGFRLGVLANQPASALDDLRRVGLADRFDGIWLSEAEGLAKPDPAFFRLALDAWTLAPATIAYVGDRPDNDVKPAKALGMFTARVRTGSHRDQRPGDAAEEPDVEADTLLGAARAIVDALKGA